ncbi:MAG: hypothetical protein U1E53_14130 [Dongiaceae bacterium]
MQRRRIVLAVALAALGAIASVIFLESLSLNRRPGNIPQSAISAGGNKGINYIDCDHISVDVNHCTVYTEYYGDVVASGNFWIKEQRRAAKAEELRFKYFDLTNIHLSNGLILSPVKQEVGP